MVVDTIMADVTFMVDITVTDIITIMEDNTLVDVITDTLDTEGKDKEITSITDQVDTQIEAIQIGTTKIEDTAIADKGNK